MLKVADVVPAGTMMLAGTVTTFALLLIRLITAPPAGAGALNVTVPVEAEPPLTLAGLSVNELSAGHDAGVDVGAGVSVDVGNVTGVGVGAGVDVDFDTDVGADVGVGDEAPIHNVAIRFELL